MYCLFQIINFQIKLNNGQCDQKPVPNCPQEGFTDVLSISSNHYYVCLRKGEQIYPQIFICPHGWEFWDGFCRPEPKPTESGPVSEVITEVTSTTENQEVNNRTDDCKGETTTTKIESFFSTDKPVTYPADTFLADKFDLTHYESTDDVAPPAEDYNSFENNDFW